MFCESAMAAPASDDVSAAIEQLYQFGERLNESKEKSKVLCNFYFHFSRNLILETIPSSR